MATSPQTASGKTLTTPPLSADAGRYLFLNLQNAEPNLSLPSKTTGNDFNKYFLLSEPLLGARSWSNNDSISLSGNNLGLGTGTPNEKLTVVGNISATGTIFGLVDGITPSLSAAGSETMVQFNSGGRLQGLPGFTFLYTITSANIGNNIIGNNAFFSSALGGCANRITQFYSGITSGRANSATDIYAYVGGGAFNHADGQYSAVVGGTLNLVCNNYGFIGAGQQNRSNGVNSAVVGGVLNISDSDQSFIGSGQGNCTCATYAAIGGGLANCIGGLNSFIGSGLNNRTSGSYTSIVGGQNNCITCNNGGILGGTANLVQHCTSFIVGSNLTTRADCHTFVNNLSAPGAVCAGNIVTNNITIENGTISPTATATNVFLSFSVGGSALALPLFRLAY
jgi:hypothetical protein